MLKFLFGRSGSGKTAHVINRIRRRVEEGKRTYLLVPEQQAFISESMLAFLPPSSALCFEVVSFTRLCRIVFGEYGGLVDARAGSGARNLVMWQTLREISSILKEYKRVKTDRELSALMLSTVDELRANGITPEDCQRAAEECEDERLAAKLSDVSAIYAGFCENLSSMMGEGAMAAENMLPRLTDLLRQHRYFEGSEIFVDSFQSFTAEERRVLEQLSLQADVTVTFCCDADRRTRRQPHTASICDEVDHFLRFAKEQGVPTESITPDALPRTEKAALLRLEKGLWDFSVRKDSVTPLKKEEEDDVELAVCKNEYEEATFAALRILQAHRSGVPFSSIALIARDVESRKGILDAVLERAGIPYFYSEKTDLSTTAAARLCFSALRCIIYNFRLSDVLTLLKTGLCGIKPIDADLFEDYCYTWSINGSAFADRWSMHPDGYTTDPLTDRAKNILLAANRVRETLIPPLLTLKRRLAAASDDTRESCRALYDYLSDAGLAEELAREAERELSEGHLREAGETLRLYDLLVTAITEISEVLSDTKTSPEDLLLSLEIMLRNTDMGSVPSVSSCVTVGSAATLRVENVRVAILLGLCEGEFPASYSPSGVFNENERGELERLKLKLAAREDTVSSDELFYLYRAMTKPSERLILCTCTSRIGGGTRTPSTAVTRAQLLLPHLKEKKTVFTLSTVRRIAALLEDGEEDDKALAERLSEPPVTEERTDQPISATLVRNIFSSKLYLSKSSISTFAECPYKYWCKYVLALREKKISAVSYNNSGTIIHYILEHFIDECKLPDGSLRQMSDEETVLAVNRLMKQYIDGIGCALPPSAMFTFSRLRDLTLIMVKSVTDEFAASDFRIVAQEMRISESAENALCPIEIRVTEEQDSPVVVLGGTIDRVDCYDNGEKQFLRVVDYKTGTHAFDVARVADGQDLQLPAYLFTAALEENKKYFGSDKPLVPASALFLSATESSGEVSTKRSGFILKDEELLRAASSSMDKQILAGITVKDGVISGGAAVSEEGIAEMDRILRSSIRDCAKSIFDGDAKRTPSKTACKFCFLRDSCPVAVISKY